jgi:hypothetical protein
VRPSADLTSATRQGDSTSTDAASSYHSAVLLQLTAPRQPAWDPPSRLAQFLPNPVKSDRQLERFLLLDVEHMSPARARLEAHAIRTRLALTIPLDQVDDLMAPWFDLRLDALDERARRAA